MLDIVVGKWMKDQTGSALRRLVESGTAATALARRGLRSRTIGPMRVDDMVGLYRSIMTALPDRPRPVIEIVAAGNGEGVSSVVRGLAQAAASVGNARVLVCDATPELDDFSHFKIPAPPANLHDFATRRASLDEAIIDVPDCSVSLCALCAPDAANRVAVNTGAVDAVFERLRERFDLIVIDAPATNASPLGAALARKVDGVVLVVEAERTRTPIAAAAIHAIEVNAGRVIGVVLNKRRLHIPGFIYRWL